MVGYAAEPASESAEGLSCLPELVSKQPAAIGSGMKRRHCQAAS
jgi:hypothetical protein